MASFNTTETGPVSMIFGRIAFELAAARNELPSYAFMIILALLPIYTSAYATLARPTSAAEPEKRKRRRKQQSKDDADADESTSSDEEDDDEGDDQEEPRTVEGLSPVDALLYPLTAGVFLAGMYAIIKWLNKPDLLNKILGLHFTGFSILAISRFISDCLNLSHQVGFPTMYADEGLLWKAHAKERRFVSEGSESTAPKVRLSPLPGRFGRFSLPTDILQLLWRIRELPSNKLTLRARAHNVSTLKLRFGLFEAMGVFMGIAAILYYHFVEKTWYLTNLMAFSLAYSGLQIITPTTFGTGSLVLGALLFYDVYMVFYTPLMITVAKTLDVPIKLLIPVPGRNAMMLGLGDVVIPGMMMGLALRFDHYMFYRGQQKENMAESDGSAEPALQVIKPAYNRATSRWTLHLWCSSWSSVIPTYNVHRNPASFPKPYFHMSLLGYVLGLVTTLGVMQVYKHGQPALLYLVPGILISLWLTAIFRRDLREFWNFEDGFVSDAGSQVETKQSHEEKPQDFWQSILSFWKQKPAEEAEKQESQKSDKEEPQSTESAVEKNTPLDHGNKSKSARQRKQKRCTLLTLSIEAPWMDQMPGVKTSSKETGQSESNRGADEAEDAHTITAMSTAVEKQAVHQRTSADARDDGQHKGKRVKMS